MSHIHGFNTEGYSTRFAGQIREFETNGFVNRKMERRMDDTIKYIIVAGKKACLPTSCPNLVLFLAQIINALPLVTSVEQLEAIWCVLTLAWHSSKY